MSVQTPYVEEVRRRVAEAVYAKTRLAAWQWPEKAREEWIVSTIAVKKSDKEKIEEIATKITSLIREAAKNGA